MYIPKIIFGLCSLFFIGCGEYTLEEKTTTEKDNMEEIPARNLTLQVNTIHENNSEIHYPLSLFVFDSKQQKVLQDNIKDGEKQFSILLSQGTYHVSAFSNLTTNHCTFPTDPVTSSSLIKLPDSPRFCSQPIQIGQARVNLKKTTQTEIKLSYAVAAINFSLNGIPTDGKNVEITLSPISSGISFSGNYTNDEQKCTIPCKKNGTLWNTETIYVLPCESSSTHISVKFQLPHENKTYSYTYQAALKPGYPYQFNGNIEEGITLNGNFQIEGWQPAVDVEFGFEEVKPEDEDNDEGKEDDEDNEIEGDESKLDTFIVPQLPMEDSIWGYFYIWKLQALSSTKAKAIILAPNQSYGLRDENIPILQRYEVDGIKNWRVFSKEEAVRFRDQFKGQMGDLNYFLEQNGLDTFYYSEGGRYLCNDCQSTFSFTSNRITDAGKTVKYYLRPVKTVLLKVK